MITIRSIMMILYSNITNNSKHDKLNTDNLSHGRILDQFLCSFTVEDLYNNIYSVFFSRDNN